MRSKITFQNVALLVVVLLTAFAAFQSQRAANKSNDTSDTVSDQQTALGSLQAEMKKNLDCTTGILFNAINALNERTTFSSGQADANIALVQAQFDLITKGQNPNLTEEEQNALFQTYVDQVEQFLTVAEQVKGQQQQFPYPTVEDLTTCLAKPAPTEAPTPSQSPSE